MKELNQMLTVKELSSYLSVSESTIRKLMRESKIPFIRIFKKILFEKKAIDNWIDNMQYNYDYKKLQELERIGK